MTNIQLNQDQERNLIEKQYKLAIDAREKLMDNYHKWMTFYYVANSAVLIAITTLFNKIAIDTAILMLSLFGLLISIFWNLSCKGYYYWSGSWINIIIELEKKVTGGKPEYGVFSVFSQKVVDKEHEGWKPVKPANISTPKLTLLFSFLAIMAWVIYSIILFTIINEKNFSTKEFGILYLLFIFGVCLIYFYYIPRFAKSRLNLHTFV